MRHRQLRRLPLALLVIIFSIVSNAAPTRTEAESSETGTEVNHHDATTGSDVTPHHSTTGQLAVTHTDLDQSDNNHMMVASRNNDETSLAGQETSQPEYENLTYSTAFTLMSTEEREELYRMRLEAIKQDILNKLGMTRIPDLTGVNMTSSVRERRKIIRLYRKSLEELNEKQSNSLFSDDQFYANQFNSFIDHGERPVAQGGGDPFTAWAPRERDVNTKRVYFAVDIPEPADPRHETVVKSATLKLFKRAVHPQNLIPTATIDRSVRVDIYQTVLRVGTDDPQDRFDTTGQSRWLRKSVDSKLVSLENGVGWEEFDVSKAVQEWIREPETNFGIEIVCDAPYELDDVIDVVTWHGGSDGADEESLEAGELPVLNVLTQTRPILPGHPRDRRSVDGRVPVMSAIDAGAEDDCTPGAGEDVRCCREPFTVSFRDIGWSSWVIEPQSYQSYFCRGACPAGYKVAHHFSRIKSLIMDANRATPLTVQCMATKLRSLSMAHYTESGLMIVSVFEDMYAEQCMCA